LIVLALLPTLVYVYVLYGLGLPEGNIDMGSTLGSYFGLLFLIASYTAIGLFTSSLSENQIVSFLVSVFLCFVFYYGFEGASTYVKGFEDVVSRIGMDYHFKSMSRGVIDTRDVLYFISIAVLFLSFTGYKLKSLKS
jgi:ABC-2 type transport system permease protein